MRSRNIKPGIFKNELLGVEDPILTIVFMGLWCAADRNGVIEDRPLRLRAEILPYRNDIDFNGYLTVLSRLGFTHRYEVGEKPYIQVVNFKKHQRPHHTEKESGLPEYTENSDSCCLTVKKPLDNGKNPPDSLIPDSLIPDSNKPDSDESEVKEFYLTKKKKKLTGKRLETFNEFWKVFNYKKGKADAADSWLNIPELTKSLVKTICDSAKLEAENRAIIKSKGLTPKHAQGWLTSRRWEDEQEINNQSPEDDGCDLPTIGEA